MPKYRVLSKNPTQWQGLEADGYTWGERLVFWRYPQGITQLTGQPPKKPSRLPFDTEAPSVVAEFAVDWVAGVVLESPISEASAVESGER